MSLSTDQYAIGHKALLEVLRGWDLAENPSEPAWENARNQFASWFERLKDEGWTRKDVYRVVREVLDERPIRFSISTLDDLANFESGLTGYCEPKSIVRFPNEPSDENQLADYVRGNRWR